MTVAPYSNFPPYFVRVSLAFRRFLRGSNVILPGPLDEIISLDFPLWRSQIADLGISS